MECLVLAQEERWAESVRVGNWEGPKGGKKRDGTKEQRWKQGEQLGRQSREVRQGPGVWWEAGKDGKETAGAMRGVLQSPLPKCSLACTALARPQPFPPLGAEGGGSQCPPGSECTPAAGLPAPHLALQSADGFLLDSLGLIMTFTPNSLYGADTSKPCCGPAATRSSRLKHSRCVCACECVQHNCVIMCAFVFLGVNARECACSSPLHPCYLTDSLFC